MKVTAVTNYFEKEELKLEKEELKLEIYKTNIKGILKELNDYLKGCEETYSSLVYKEYIDKFFNKEDFYTNSLREIYANNTFGVVCFAKDEVFDFTIHHGSLCLSPPNYSEEKVVKIKIPLDKILTSEEIEEALTDALESFFASKQSII